jgi:hypothetical protein
VEHSLYANASEYTGRPAPAIRGDIAESNGPGLASRLRPHGDTVTPLALLPGQGCHRIKTKAALVL